MSVTYASYTYRHPNVFVSYPHRRRLELLKKIIDRRPVGRWLDYGSGDGEVFRYFAEHVRAVDAVLYEPGEKFHAEALANLGEKHSARLVKTRSEIHGSFDLITAFEVLEHLPLPERTAFFQLAARRLTSDGRMLLEVPIEIGPILLVKEWGRRFLKGRMSGYGVRELLAAAFLGRVEDVQNRYDPDDPRAFITLHQGFDIRRFEREIGRIGTVIRTYNSPIGVLPSSLNQCRIYDFRLDCRDEDQIATALMS